MLDISKARVGLIVMVEDNNFFVPGVIIVIDPDSNDIGVKEVFSDEIKRFPAEKVHTRYPYHNGYKPGFSTSPLNLNKDRNLLRLLGGYVITLSEGIFSPEVLKEVAEEIKKTGIAQEGTRAQEVISTLR